MNSNPPSGAVTFLFTDIEGSTKLWEQYPEAMKAEQAYRETITAWQRLGHRAAVANQLECLPLLQLRMNKVSAP